MALRLKSRNHSPIGGFIVDVPEISNTHRVFWDFKTAANALWDLLQANPGILRRFPHLPQNREACDYYVDSRNAQRMLTIPSGNNYVAEDGPIPKLSPLPRAVAGLQRLAVGAANLTAWLGDGGKPVEQTLANARAVTCVTCPKNERGGLETWFTGVATELIRKTLAIRNDLGMQTPVDDKLCVCSACTCPLKLKVHVPLTYITRKLSDEQKAALDPRCWVLKGT